MGLNEDGTLGQNQPRPLLTVTICFRPTWRASCLPNAQLRVQVLMSVHDYVVTPICRADANPPYSRCLLRLFTSRNGKMGSMAAIIALLTMIHTFRAIAAVHLVTSRFSGYEPFMTPLRSESNPMLFNCTRPRCVIRYPPSWCGTWGSPRSSAVLSVLAQNIKQIQTIKIADIPRGPPRSVWAGSPPCVPRVSGVGI